jgi:hypothetical protein
MMPKPLSGYIINPVGIGVGSIKGDVKRKQFSPSAERGYIFDIQPLGCGCHADLMERVSRCDGLK